MDLRILTLVFTTLITISNGLPSINTTSLVSHRDARFFPFYTLGRFSQDVCVGTNALVGTCVLTGQCSDLGGTSTGTAACSQANTNQASCCIVTQTCSSTTQFNNTYFVNSGYPRTFPGGSVCTIQITRQGTDICQLKINFLDFSLAQPTGDGACTNDYFQAIGGSSFVPKICGENSGQHVYVAFSGNNPITIRVATSGSFTFNRRWHFHLQQIGCDSPSMAPSGCLQYWQDSSGWVSSFNYASGGSGVTNSIGVQGSRQIANLAYGICIKASPGTCSITYSIPTTDIYAFTVTGDVGAIDPAVLGTSAVQEQTCTTDFVTIPDAQQNGVLAAGGDRFCGLGIAATTSNAFPYVIYTVTDGNETPDIALRTLSSIVTFLIIGSFNRKSKSTKLTEFSLIVSLFTLVRSQTFVDYLNDYESDEDYFDDYFEEPEFGGPFDHQHHHHEREPISIRVCGGNNSVVHGNNSMLANPNYPLAYGGGRICSYRIHKRNFERGHRHVCQLRIDFLVLSLAQPTGDGVCSTDYFTVIGGSTSVPKICGENTGQHVYVGTAGILPITIVVATTATNSFNRRWQLRVTQVGCHSRFKAPPNCLQYYIESTGFIRSFNYASESNGNANSIGVTGSRQIANMQYNICIRVQPGLCSITYTKPASERFCFSLTGDVNSVDPTIIGSAVLQSQNCATDYITIQAPSQINRGSVTPLSSNRFCGLGIGQIITMSRPFIVSVTTDGNETPDIGNRGFYLNYAQGICTRVG